MKTCIRLTALVLLALFLAGIPAVPAQVPDVPPFRRDDPPGPPPPVPGADADEPEILARGPVHEAFAMPSEAAPRPSPVVPKAPPAAIEEIPPEIKPEGDNVVWVPGYWAWDEDRGDFIWVSGVWRVLPPGRKWVPGYWTKTLDGHRWVSGLWADASVPEVPYVDEPPAPLDYGPTLPAMDDTSFYVPGIWVFNDRWLWRPGFWLPWRAGWMYTPPRWCWTPRGFLFCSGFWDRPLGGRGMLFAPAFFPGSRAGLAFRPRHVIGPNALTGSLWMRRGQGYAFGDFYGDRYARRGYSAWAVNGGRTRDPLFSYYQGANRTNRTWAADLVRTHNARARGDVTLPRTLRDQDRLTSDRTRPAPRMLDRVDRVRSDDLRLTKVTATDRAERERLTSGLARASVERRVLETRSSVRSRPSLPVRDVPAPKGITRAPTTTTPGIIRSDGGPRVTRPIDPPSPRPTTPGLRDPGTTRPPRVEAPRPTTPGLRDPGTTRPPAVTRPTTPSTPGLRDPGTTRPPRVEDPRPPATRPTTPSTPGLRDPGTTRPPAVTRPTTPSTPGLRDPGTTRPPAVSPPPRMTTPPAPRIITPAPRPATPAPRITPPAPRYTPPAPRYTPPAPRYSPPPRSAAPSRPSAPPRSAPPAGRPGRPR